MLRSALSILIGIAILTIASFAIEASLTPLLLRMFPRTLSSDVWVRTVTFGYGMVSEVFWPYRD